MMAGGEGEVAAGGGAGVGQEDMQGAGAGAEWLAMMKDAASPLRSGGLLQVMRRTHKLAN